MPPYSGMETILIALITALVSCVGLFFAMSKVFMTRKECQVHLQNNTSSESQTCKKIDQLMNIQNLQFRMLRTMILYMDLPQDKKEKILNMKGKTSNEQ